jgi:ribosome-associated protein
MKSALIVTPNLTIPERDISWIASRSSGPGGQNVNKVSSKIELRFDLARTTALDHETRERLRTIAGNRVDSNGMVLIVSQLTRDQIRNLDDAREKLRAMILRALERPKPREPTKPSRRARARRVADKRRQGEKKLGRRTTHDE